MNPLREHTSSSVFSQEQCLFPLELDTLPGEQAVQGKCDFVEFTSLLQGSTQMCKLILPAWGSCWQAPIPLQVVKRAQSRLWFTQLQSLIATTAAPFNWSHLFSGFAAFFTATPLLFLIPSILTVFISNYPNSASHRAQAFSLKET